MFSNNCQSNPLCLYIAMDRMAIEISRRRQILVICVQHGVVVVVFYFLRCSQQMEILLGADMFVHSELSLEKKKKIIRAHDA